MKLSSRKLSVRGLIKGTAIVSTLLTVSCFSKDETAPTNELSKLQLEINTQNLSSNQLQLSEAISSNAESKNLLLTAFIELHRKDYEQQKPNASLPSDAQTLEDIQNLTVSQDISDLHNLKTAMENTISTNQGEIFYNKNKASLFSYLRDQKMQCYSGTSLFEVLRHVQTVPGVSAEDYVVIFESGHVLPGYMVRKEDGFHLIGIETTVNGLGTKKYGSVSNLQGVRVVDAEFFMAIEVFEGELNNESSVFDRALEITAQRYNIPLQNIEDGLKKDFEMLYSYQSNDIFINSGLTIEQKASALNDKRENLRTVINASIFEFGSANVDRGDQKRATADDIQPSMRGSGVINGEGVFLDLQAVRTPEEQPPVSNEKPQNYVIQPQLNTTAKTLQDILFTAYNENCSVKSSQETIHVRDCMRNSIFWQCTITFNSKKYLNSEIIIVDEVFSNSFEVQYQLNSHLTKDGEALFPKYVQARVFNEARQIHFDRTQETVSTQDRREKPLCSREE